MIMISSEVVNEAAGHAEDFLKKFFKKAGRDIKCDSKWEEGKCHRFPSVYYLPCGQ